jgi:hypothetical protein
MEDIPFSPPERGNMQANSTQTYVPARERRYPSTQRKREAPTLPTLVAILEGVPVPPNHQLSLSLKSTLKFTEYSGANNTAPDIAN